jgi:hypothetical protein
MSFDSYPSGLQKDPSAIFWLKIGLVEEVLKWLAGLPFHLWKIQAPEEPPRSGSRGYQHKEFLNIGVSQLFFLQV